MNKGYFLNVLAILKKRKFVACVYFENVDTSLGDQNKPQVFYLWCNFSISFTLKH